MASRSFGTSGKTSFAEFGEDHLAVAPDMRGYNLSAKPAEVDQYQINPGRRCARLGRSPGSRQEVRSGCPRLGRGSRLVVCHGCTLRRSRKLVIINAPHPGVFARLLASDPAQQKASQYMLLFRSPQAEQMLSANNYAGPGERGHGPGLKTGALTEEDKTGIH